jgi:hypothetical protein
MPTLRALGAIVCAVAVCASLHAQTDETTNTVSVKLLDGKTGMPVKPTNFVLKIDHHDALHNEWVTIHDDGTVTVTLPDSAKELSLKATYDMGMEWYINCDAAKQSDKERDIWYPVAAIMKSGLVAPNECSKTQYTAKPGEFVFFVRKRSPLDKFDY